MNVHVRPAATKPENETSLGPRERLDRLHHDMREAKAELRDVLERLAGKHAIPQRDVSYALDGYADDMLSDLVYGIERDLEHQCEEVEP